MLKLKRNLGTNAKILNKIQSAGLKLLRNVKGRSILDKTTY